MGSIFGGILTIFMAVILAFILAGALRTIYEHRQADMVQKIDMFDENKRPPENITMANFENSLNFFWGIQKRGDDWDILNNPYVEFKGHQLTTGEKFNNVHELKLCTYEEMRRFLPRDEVVGWFPSAICFANPEDVYIDKNWFMEGYSNPMIGLSYCRNKTENGNWCKPRYEIEDFLRQYP